MESMGTEHTVCIPDDVPASEPLHLPHIVTEKVAEHHHTKKNGDKAVKRTLGIQRWLKIDPSGEQREHMLDKYKLVHEYGVQLRDLRILDPKLATSYPSAILCREKAIIVNIEHIRIIITPDSVMVRYTAEDTVKQFVDMIKRKLTQSGATDLGNASTLALSGPPGVGMEGRREGALKGSASAMLLQDLLRTTNQQFPFELRVLEVCLEQVASQMDGEVTQLEDDAHLALEKLTQMVTAHNLERVRKTKTRLNRLTTKVETMREVLEKLLDDDKDMLSMNLTAKVQHELQGISPRVTQEGPGSQASSESSDSDDEEDDIAKVEMLLEPYFMQIDNTYNRLQTLKEYIDDTEDLINIKLDQHRNRLIGMDLLFTAAMFALSLITAVTGIFGMNLNNRIENSTAAFNVVSAGSSGIAIGLFILFVFICHRKKLLNFW